MTTPTNQASAAASSMHGIASAASSAAHSAAAVAASVPGWFESGSLSFEIAKGLPAAFVTLVIGGIAAWIAMRQLEVAADMREAVAKRGEVHLIGLRGAANGGMFHAEDIPRDREIMAWFNLEHNSGCRRIFAPYLDFSEWR